MESQKSLTSTSEKYADLDYANAISLVPESKQFEQCYAINRIKLQTVCVSEVARDKVLEALSSGKMFVQIGNYTIMLNTISSIEPLPIKDKRLWEERELRRKSYQEMRTQLEN